MIENQLNIYQTDFLCTYQYINEYDESFILYQVQFLQVFNLNVFDENIINEITELLYNKYKNNKYIIELISTDNKLEIIDDGLIRFRQCFEYERFYKLHNILCNLINQKEKIIEDCLKNSI